MTWRRPQGSSHTGRRFDRTSVRCRRGDLNSPILDSNQEQRPAIRGNQRQPRPASSAPCRWLPPDTASCHLQTISSATPLPGSSASRGPGSSVPSGRASI
jgi:hypothetical protein